MKKILHIVLLLALFTGTAQADFWKKIVNIKTVDDTRESNRDYGYQNGYYDAVNRPGYNGRVAERRSSDHHYNRGYERGYNQAQFDQGGVIVVERPRIVYEQQVYIVEPRNNGYDEVPHFELFQ